MDGVKAKLDEYEYIIRAQMSEIDKLRARENLLDARIKQLVDWIMGESDALTCLQAVYNNPASPEGNRIKAAASALPFERPKLSVQVSVRGPAVLGERLDQANGMKTVNPPLIEHGTRLAISRPLTAAWPHWPDRSLQPTNLDTTPITL
jgi:hypothetical protein